MDTTILTDPFIFVMDDVIPKKECTSIIRRFNKDKRQERGITTGGIDLEVKDSHDLGISKYDDWKDVDERFAELISYLLQQYTQHLINAGTLTMFTNHKSIALTPPSTNLFDIGYQVQKTKKGKGYTWHHDYIQNRVITFILYLNTVEEGWTQFYNGDQVAPKAGRCIMFPATWTYFHQGYPPKQTKYIMTGWLHNVD